MKTLKQYLPESFLAELSPAETDSTSPISGGEVDDKPDVRDLPTKPAAELNMGDVVKIGPNVQFSNERGKISDFGQDKRFVIVDLFAHGKHSFHSSDVLPIDELDDEDEDEFAVELGNMKRLSGY